MVDKETENFKGQIFLDTFFSPNPTKTLIRDDNNWKAVKAEIMKIKKLIKVIRRFQSLEILCLKYLVCIFSNLYSFFYVKETARVEPKTDKERALVKLCSIFRRLDSAYRFDNPIDVTGDIETYASIGIIEDAFS